MKEMMIIIRPEKLEELKVILDAFHCGGMTISTAMGCGTQKGNMDAANMFAGFHTSINLIPKIVVKVVTEDEKVEDIILKIREKIATNHVGDGKIFISPIDDAVRIRTGERGEKAL